MFKFADPYLLLLIPIVILMFLKINKKSSIKIPGIENIRQFKSKTYKSVIGKYLILISVILMIFALSRPQIVNQNTKIKKNGIDIVIALDLSQSMLREDFNPNRLEKAKILLGEFLNKRPNDRISLVVFGGDAYTKVPLTFDHDIVSKMVKEMSVNDITSNNRTAIGMGLGIAINRLKTSDAKSKVIILMTDGENNSGEMNPISAAHIAKELGIKIYTIGIGAHEISNGFFKVSNTELDENLLKDIATITNGKYFRASNSQEFQEIFNTIDKLEKTKIDGRIFYQKTELYDKILIVAMFILLLGIYFEYKKYIKIP